MANTQTPIRRAVRVWLADKDRTQVWLAQRLRISQGTLSLILDGYRKPSEDLNGRLFRLTGVDVLGLEREAVSA